MKLVKKAPMKTSRFTLFLCCFLMNSCSDKSSSEGRNDAWVDSSTMCKPLQEKQGQPGEAANLDTYNGRISHFFQLYCVRCHSSKLTSEESRRGAPADLNWDNLGTIEKNLSRIRQMVGVSEQMPPSSPTPSCDERRQLVRWIDIHAPDGGVP